MYDSALYLSSNVTLQEYLLSARSLFRKAIRQGLLFNKMQKELHHTERLDAAGMKDYQREKLRDVVSHAIRHVPRYRNLTLDSAILSWPSQELLSKFPVLTKDDIRAAPHEFLWRKPLSIRFKASTSGTTGSPMYGWRDVNSIAAEMAFNMRHLRWAGFTPGDRLAWLRGDQIVPLNEAQGPFHRVDHVDRTLMLSSYHLSAANAKSYISMLEQYNPTVIQAYPASIAFLARWMIERGISYRSSCIKGIVTSSETLSNDQRKAIELAFGVRVFDRYGAFERVASIATCEHGNYHLLLDYGYVEFSPNDAQIPLELIGTSFYNLVMPLIRYKTVDSVVLADHRYVCPCGRAFPVVERILGRVDDLIQTRDGKLHTAADFIFSDLYWLEEAQVIQEELDLLRLRLVVRCKISADDERELQRRVHKRFGADMRVEIEQVQVIPRSPGGKFRGVISKLHHPGMKT